MPTDPLTYVERPADGDADGLLVLHHGRGSHEGDLIGLADELDPARRLHVVAPRAPMQLPGMPGFHWYVVPRVGHPDPATFASSTAALAAFHDETWQRTGIGPEDTVLAGFSMGSVMSFAMGLDPERPAVAGILGWSGFIPVVDGWDPALDRAGTTPVLISHGRTDPVIPYDFAVRAEALLAGAGFDVTTVPHDGAHWIDPGALRSAIAWIDAVLPAATSRPVGSP